MPGTNKSLIGKKVLIRFKTIDDPDPERIVLATIDRLSKTYPKHAYIVSWTKQDNPKEQIPDDCAGFCSMINFQDIVGFIIKNNLLLRLLAYPDKEAGGIQRDRQPAANRA